jgi:hypothetical protein
VDAGLSARSAFAQSMKCEIGPVAKNYGSTPWLVYGCDDAKSVVLLAAPGNPAMPFYFIFHPVDGVYRLEGEGTGDKSATTNAVNELKKLSESDIAALIEETRKVQNAPVR